MVGGADHHGGVGDPMRGDGALAGQDWRTCLVEGANLQDGRSQPAGRVGKTATQDPSLLQSIRVSDARLSEDLDHSFPQSAAVKGGGDLCQRLFEGIMDIPFGAVWKPALDFLQEEGEGFTVTETRAKRVLIRIEWGRHQGTRDRQWILSP